jgi:hypothetical protein
MAQQSKLLKIWGNGVSEMTKSELLKNAKPIIFNTEMVRAILNGRKTQTRRVIKKIPENTYRIEHVDENLWEASYGVYGDFICMDLYKEIKPPYQIGQVLYVREKWQEVYETEVIDYQIVDVRNIIVNFDDIPKTCVGLSTEWSMRGMKPRNKYYVYGADNIKYADGYDGLRWQSPAIMPKEAVRIFLKVTDVMVERLQNITDEDAKAEGSNHKNGKNVGVEEKLYKTAIDRFVDIWDSTIKKSDLARYGWDANPYVWVVEFERVKFCKS